jgi:Phytanoyl-CoA dioxygenase (PhyH)
MSAVSDSRDDDMTRCAPARDAELLDAVRRTGWAITSPVIPSALVDSLSADIEPVLQASDGGGIRNTLDLPGVRSFAASSVVRGVAAAVLGDNCFAVRGLLFDKTPNTNWKVAWHQDLSIAVRERQDTPGFGPWSEKMGVVHAQAPVEILDRMLAIRVHLDDCYDENGPLRVISGSHRDGKLGSAEIERWRTLVAPTECIAQRGSILALRPLLLHSSAQARSPARRRVLHFEFACDVLPGGLAWHWTV